MISFKTFSDSMRAELQRRGIDVQTALTGSLPLVTGHAGQLQQVILNLVENAADAMDTVSTRAQVLRVKTAIYDFRRSASISRRLRAGH